MTLIASDSRPIRSTAARSPGHRPFGTWMLGSPLYSLTLGHRSPKSFFAVAPDPWPGDPTLGQRLVVGEFAAFGVVGAVTPASDDPPWQRAGANPRRHHRMVALFSSSSTLISRASLMT